MDWNLYTAANAAERLYFEHLSTFYGPRDRDAALLDPALNGAPGSLLRSLYDNRNNVLKRWHDHVAKNLVNEAAK